MFTSEFSGLYLFLQLHGFSEKLIASYPPWNSSGKVYISLWFQNEFGPPKWKLLNGTNISSLKLTVCTWKWMVGRLSGFSFWGPNLCFSGRLLRCSDVDFGWSIWVDITFLLKIHIISIFRVDTSHTLPKNYRGCSGDCDKTMGHRQGFYIFSRKCICITWGDLPSRQMNSHDIQRTSKSNSTKQNYHTLPKTTMSPKTGAVSKGRYLASIQFHFSGDMLVFRGVRSSMVSFLLNREALSKKNESWGNCLHPKHKKNEPNI